MKINKIILSVSSLAVCGTLSAQDLRGVVRDADNQPLVGASVYWEGTTIGASTDAQGAFLLHRVKGYDNLVASYLGYVNDTLRVAGGAERIEFTLASEGVALEDVVVEGNLSGNFVKRDGIVKGEMISFAGLCKMACCNLAESFENSASVTVGYSDAISGARPGARREVVESYIKRLETLEALCNGFEGVESSYAVQAGREVRILVQPDKISDDEVILLARNVAKKIENELDYPGQIKVSVIRESRATEYAK